MIRSYTGKKVLLMKTNCDEFTLALTDILNSAHEYTLSNAKFAISVEPNNVDLVQRIEIVKSKRARNEATIPTIMGEEKKANPFLRIDFSEEIRNNVGVTLSDTAADGFGKLRRAKDKFR